MTEEKYLKGIVKARDNLSLLTVKIHNKEYKGNDYFWGGAGIVIGEKPPPKSKGWWPDERYLVTPYAKELSWLFIQLRDVFYDIPLIDYFNKYEFFARLLDASEAYVSSVDDGIGNREELLMVVNREADVILKEMLSMFPHGE